MSKRGVVAFAVLAALLVIGASAGTWVWFASTDDVGGAVTETQMRKALAEAGARQANWRYSDWGMEGKVYPVPGPHDHCRLDSEFHLYWKASEKAVESYSTGACSPTASLRKQAAGFVNYRLEIYDSPPRYFVGRDEDPNTVGFGSALPLENQSFARFHVEDKQGVRFRGEPATRFDGNIGDESFRFTLHDADAHLARVEHQTSSGARLDLTYLRTSEIPAIETSPAGHRMSFALHSEEDFPPAIDGKRRRNGTVTADHNEEVRLDQVEMRFKDFVNGDWTPVASMRLDVGQQTMNNVTFAYHDLDRNGLVSAGDTYEFGPAPTSWLPRFYDLWANADEGGPNS